MIEHDYIECGDCLKLMKELPDNSIDLIVTDPPYLMSYKTNYRINKPHKFCTEIAGDDDEELIKNYIAECYRIMKNDTAMYMFCNSNKVDFFKIELEKYFTIKNMIIWVKNNWTAGDLKCAYGKQYEIMFLVNKGRCEIRGKRLTDVWEFNRVAGKSQLHQNEKPIKLIKQCIEKHSDEGDIVFDGFMGSGTTAVACVKTGRHYIGCELDPEYYDIACKRLDEVESPDYVDPEILAYTE